MTPTPGTTNSAVVDGHSFIDELLAPGTDNPAAAFAAGLAAAPPAEIGFTIKRFILQLLLDRAATVVPTRDVMPVLKNFQIDVRPGRLRVIASDTELSMIATTELVEVDAPGVAVFPARKMLDIVREADEGDVRIRVRGQAAAITIGRTTWNLMLAGGADYPAMPEITEVTLVAVERAAFAASLHAVRYAACRDANRASLNMIDVAHGRMTACDGARFAQAGTAELPFTCQIPIGAVDDLLKLLKGSDLTDIHVGESKLHLIFRLGADVFIVNKLIAQFPDLEALWLRPALSNKQPLRVERADLLTAIKRVRITADPNTSAIGLHLAPAAPGAPGAPGRLSVSARDKYKNAAEETIDEVGWDGPERTLVVNHAFLTDMIGGHTGPTLTFLLGEDTKTRKAPLLLRDPDTGTVAVVQQMLLDWTGA